MYAKLCRIISEDAPNFETHNHSQHKLNHTFCRLLLAKCQDEFEHRRRASEAFDAKDEPLTASEEEQRSIAKHKMLGNIKFICELGKQNLLQESILHKCIQQLLSKKRRDQTIQDKAEDLECLCQIMKTVGRLLDNEKARHLMDQYFERMENYASRELNCRIRFMLQDVLELRRNKWLPRHIQREYGPKTILQIREEAAKDYGVYLPPHQYTFGPVVRSGAHSKQDQRMADDMFSPFPAIGVGAYPLGTGPGAINDISAFPRRTHNNVVSPQLNNMSANTNYQQKRDNRSQQQTQQQSIAPNISQQNITNTTGGRELPPRFLRQQQMQQTLQQQQQSQQTNALQMINAVPQHVNPINPLALLANHHQSMDSNGISLRPPQNSMVLKPNIPLKLTPNNISLNTNNNSNILKSYDSFVLIKTNKVNKTSPNTNDVTNNTKHTKNHSNKDDILKITEDTLNNFIVGDQNIDEMVDRFKDMKIPKNFQFDVLVTIIRKSLDKSESNREVVSKLLNSLKAEDVIGSSIFMNAFKEIISKMDELEIDIPRVKSNVAMFMSAAVADDVVTLKELSEPLEGGQYYPLFLLCLQHLHKSNGQSWLFDKFSETKINLMQMLPENDRNKERMAEILEDRSLSFLYPMLRIESELWKQITQVECTPNSLYRWVKDNVDANLQNGVEFIQVLFTCLLKYITSEVNSKIENESQQTQTEGQTVICDYEREILSKFQSVLKAFLHEKASLQLMLLYALQNYWSGLEYPKGMFLRWFVMLYDMEIVEEEVFIKWKEDLNDDFPGKGKALFQVNNWLTWLEEAEEEDDDDDASEIRTK